MGNNNQKMKPIDHFEAAEIEIQTIIEKLILEDPTIEFSGENSSDYEKLCIVKNSQASKGLRLITPKEFIEEFHNSDGKKLTSLRLWKEMNNNPSIIHKEKEEKNLFKIVGKSGSPEYQDTSEILSQAATEEWPKAI